MSHPVDFRCDPRTVPEEVHGGVDVRELARSGLDSVTVLDFSTNVNPFGPSPRVAEAVRSVSLGEYPDRECTLLRRAISRKLDVSMERVLCGNGSSELLQLIAQTQLQPNDRAIVLDPTYGEYRRTALLRGAGVRSCPASAMSGFVVDRDAVEQTLRSASGRVCYLCSPNNPTGQVIAAEWIQDWSKRFASTLFVVDEAYLDYVPRARSLIEFDLPNVIVLRSLTKAHGLAGLRLGYAVARPEVIDQLKHARIPWSVNSIAQAAGMVALGDESHVKQSVHRLFEGRQHLLAGLSKLGVPCVESATPFFLANVGSAARVCGQLRSMNVLVRDGTSFGLPASVRIAPRSPDENVRLLESLAQIL